MIAGMSTRQFPVAEAPDLDVTGNTSDQGEVSLREVLVHMVEEYASHNGHADLLRERIDGRSGSSCRVGDAVIH
jgi:hypothetical protein